ncbi:MAG TPA: hypothetical protein DEF51_52875 [Myxococcales bacterium]|nr:hypothetical protein [Myxococcales bacterium]
MKNQILTLLSVAVALTGLVGCGESTEGAFGRDGRPALGAQIDRTGRPAISTALVETFNGDDAAKGEAKDRYNTSTPSTASSFMGTVQGSLAILDALDAECGNQLLAGDTAEAGRYETLASILLDDRLYVHTERTTCGTYLGLEAEVVGAVPEGMGGCGGRTPSDDVIDRSYSVLAAGILTGVDDTITADDGAQTPTFPFLGAPTR